MKQNLFLFIVSHYFEEKPKVSAMIEADLEADAQNKKSLKCATYLAASRSNQLETKSCSTYLVVTKQSFGFVVLLVQPIMVL